MNITDNNTFLKRKKLTKKIAEEHFNMSLGVDKNLNYLWYMYTQGINKGIFKSFIFLTEMALLVSLGVITEEERNNLNAMFASEDEDNYYLALLSLEAFRNKRIKIHGVWNDKMNVSNEFKELIFNYPMLMKFHPLHKEAAK